MASFALEEINENKEGWGPSSFPALYEGLPFLSFGKGDKLTRIADWTSSSRYNRQGDLQASAFSFSSTDDGSFTIVDNQKVQPKYSRTKRYNNQYRSKNYQQQPQSNTTSTKSSHKQHQAPRQGKRWRNHAYRYQRYIEKKTYDPSVVVKPEWKVVESIDMNMLEKVMVSDPPAEEVASVGSVRVIDPSFLKMTARNERPLQYQESGFFNKPLLDDPVLQNISKTKAANIYASDLVISILMTCTDSVYPWDIVVEKKDSQLFLSKREGSKIDFYSVGENELEPPSNDKESINSANALSREATMINQFLSRQIVTDEVVDITKNKEFVPSGYDIGNPCRAYTYRKFKLSDSMDMIVRCDIDAAIQSKKGDKKLTIVNALNEYDLSKTSWRSKLDTQPGAVFATELKANLSKLQKWYAKTILSGIPQFTLGYVSRQPSNHAKHAILKVVSYKPDEFGTHINASSKNMWGKVVALCNLLMQQEDGKYILMKEPNDPTMLLYKTS